jgi:hypothetical protein
MDKQQLEQAIKNAKADLASAERALADWEEKPENNVFATMEDATATIEEALCGRASDDCEGSYNCGDSEYRRQFMVGGKAYVGILTCEYNRHDKTYYYLEEHDFRVEEVAA